MLMLNPHLFAGIYTGGYVLPMVLLLFMGALAVGWLIIRRYLQSAKALPQDQRYHKYLLLHLSNSPRYGLGPELSDHDPAVTEELTALKKQTQGKLLLVWIAFILTVSILF